MTEIKLVVADVDGTILDDKHQLDNQLSEAVKQLKEKNIPFVLSSARPPNTMYHFAKELGIEHQPMSCYNGALILKEGNGEHYAPIFNHILPNEEADRMVRLIEAEFAGVSINLYSDEQWFVNRADSWSALEESITGEKAVVKNIKKYTQDDTYRIHKLLLIGETDEISDLMEHLETLNLKESSFYLSKENYLEVTHKNVSKEKSLMEIASYFDVPLSQTLALGDNFNDLPMLLTAGVGIAMENGPIEVQEQADYVAGSNNENGAAQAIETYILN